MRDALHLGQVERFNPFNGLCEAISNSSKGWSILAEAMIQTTNYQNENMHTRLMQIQKMQNRKRFSSTK